MKENIPLYYFKPTICWVDDDAIFLEAVNITFKEKYNCLLFTDPHEALDYFASYVPPTSSINIKREFKESDLFDNHNHYPIDINLAAITDIASIANKAAEISLLVIDYKMPGLNGIEICKKTAHLPFKKILLTGDASHEKAIEAFNQGLIHKFIKKDHQLTDHLARYVSELSRAYFEEKTKYLITDIDQAKLSFLSDPIFVSFFNQLCFSRHITEFYLLNRQGNFLLKDNQGKLIYFISMSESELTEFTKLHDDAADKISEVLNQIKRGKMLPFFGRGKEPWEVDLEEWKHHLYPANIIKGKEKYYWTIVNNDIHHDE